MLRVGRRTEGRPSRVTSLGLLLVVLAAAAALRLHRLDFDSLWYDEAHSLGVARAASVADAITEAARGAHPALYFLTLRAWLHLAPATETGIRLLSALLGIAGVAAVYGLARALSLPRAAGLLGAALLALNPHAIWYAQEARMYALASCLGTLHLAAAAALFLRRPANRGPLAAWLVSGAALLYTHYYGVFLITAGGVFGLAAAARIRAASPRARKRAKADATGPLRALLAGAAFWGLAWAPQGLAMLWNAQTGAGVSWLGYKVTWATPWHILRDLATGQMIAAAPGWLRVAAALAALALFLAGPILAARRGARGFPGRRVLGAWAPAAATLVVLGSAVLVSLWRVILFGGQRYPTVAAGPFCLAIGLGLYVLLRRAWAWRAAGGAAAVLLVAAQVVYLADYYAVRKKTMWREAMALVSGLARDGDVLAPVPGMLREPVDYYNARGLTVRTVDEVLTGPASRVFLLDSLPPLGAGGRLAAAGWRARPVADVQSGLPSTLVRVTLFERR